MISLRVSFFIILLAAPELLIGLHRGRNVLDVKISANDELHNKCLKSGLELRYRFKLKACKRRTAWFDECKDELVITQTSKYDPISETYRVVTDTLGDKDDPRTQHLTTPEEVLSTVGRIESVPVPQLTRADDRYSDPRKSYVRARVESECKGEYSETLANISSILTLGFVDLGKLDSGWTDFNWENE